MEKKVYAILGGNNDNGIPTLEGVYKTKREASKALRQIWKDQIRSTAENNDWTQKEVEASFDAKESEAWVGDCGFDIVYRIVPFVLPQ